MSSLKGAAPTQRNNATVVGDSKRATADNTEASSVPLNLPLLLNQSIRKTEDANSNASDKGNNSDGTSSALASLGNDYFGFNFDEENMLNGNSPPSKIESSESEGDGDKCATTSSKSKHLNPDHGARYRSQEMSHRAFGSSSGNSLAVDTSLIKKLGQSRADASIGTAHKPSHDAAAAAAVANLQSIANESVASSFKSGVASASSKDSTNSKRNLKRKAVSVQDHSNEYDSDECDPTKSTISRQAGTTSSSMTEISCSSNTISNHESNIKSENCELSDSVPTPVESSKFSGRKEMNDLKREQRNAREKERSFRIAKQISELRGLLSTGGVIVPKGTKSSVLTEAANYIRMLQQHQYRSEIDRHQLIQQMQVIGGGNLGPQAANAIRHVAAQNGVWSLGNFGGLPPRTAMTSPPNETSSTQKDTTHNESSQQQGDKSAESLLTSIEEHDYRFIFNSSLIGMAVASMGGAFIDCNLLFTQLSQYTKQEICSMTIFNLTSRIDLQHAFDLVSQMISPPIDGASSRTIPRCVLRGSMKHRTDLGLSITLIKGDDGIAKCFCVTLIQNPSSPFDTSRPIPATADFLTTGQPQMDSESQIKQDEKMAAPAFMTG